MLPDREFVLGRLSVTFSYQLQRAFVIVAVPPFKEMAHAPWPRARCVAGMYAFAPGSQITALSAPLTAAVLLPGLPTITH